METRIRRECQPSRERGPVSSAVVIHQVLVSAFVLPFRTESELCISDPNTKAWVKNSLEKTFGYPSIARFSWTTVRVALDDGAHAVEWYVTPLVRKLLDQCLSISRIDDGQASLVKAFENGTGHDKGRCAINKDLCLSSVGTL